MSIRKFTAAVAAAVTLLSAGTFGGAEQIIAGADSIVTYTYISQSGSFWSDSPARNFIDGDINTKWGTSSTNPSVTFRASEPILVTGYSLTTGTDTGSNKWTTGRNPKSWKLYGSNDSTNWVVIDEVNNDTTMPDKRLETVAFDCEDTTVAYEYFKFEVTSTGNNGMQLNELTLDYTSPKPNIGEKTGDVTVTHTKKESGTVYSVDLSWGSMNFTYNEQTVKNWDPEALSYDEEVVSREWSCDEGANVLTVTNHSNAAVDVDIAYTPSAEMNIGGTVTYDEDFGGTLATAVDTDTDNAPTVTARFDPKDYPTKEFTDGTVIGNITVTLSKEGV